MVAAVRRTLEMTEQCSLLMVQSFSGRPRLLEILVPFEVDNQDLPGRHAHVIV
jgi:hypothetical protein